VPGRPTASIGTSGMVSVSAQVSVRRSYLSFVQVRQQLGKSRNSCGITLPALSTSRRLTVAVHPMNGTSISVVCGDQFISRTLCTALRSVDGLIPVTRPNPDKRIVSPIF
jgi:hypothetical protein